MSNLNKLYQERTETIVVLHDFSKLGDGPIEKLPPHITLLYLQGVMSRKAADLISSFEIVARETSGFGIERGELAYYGDNNEMPVDLIEDPNNLQSIHESLLQAAWLHEVPVDYKYAGPKNYSPHSTRNDGFIMPEQVEIGSLSVVRKFGDKTMQNVRFVFSAIDS